MIAWEYLYCTSFKSTAVPVVSKYGVSHIKESAKILKIWHEHFYDVFL